MKKNILKSLLTIILVISLVFNAIPVYANVKGNNKLILKSGKMLHVYEYDDFSVEYNVTDYWENAYNVKITIKNTGKDVIDNWGVSFDISGEITNIWNASIFRTQIHSESNNITYEVKNLEYNADIAVGEEINFGFSVLLKENSEALIPECFKMLQKQVIIPKNDYSVSSFIYGDTSYNYNGMIILQNTSTEKIEDWILSFKTDMDIYEFYTVDVVEKLEDGYIIKNRGYNSIINPYESLVIGFTAIGKYGVIVNGTINDTTLLDTRIGVEQMPLPTVIEPSLVPSLSPTSVEITNTPEPTVVLTPTEYISTTPIESPIPSIPELTLTDKVTPAPSEMITEKPTMAPTDVAMPSVSISPSPTTIEESDYSDEELYSDYDGDGLPFYLELLFETDPYDADTDGDGISDMIEIIYKSNPLKADDGFCGENDSDCDGIIDIDEIKVYKTNPLNKDTDKDGLNDLFEIDHGFDPLNNDTNKDGVIDSDEEFYQIKTVNMKQLGYEYDDLCNAVGENIILFDESYRIPESFGAIKSVSVKTCISGDIEEKINIENIFAHHVYSSLIPMRVGIPFEINTESKIESAEIIFEYDEELLGDIDENDLCIAWYDEGVGLFKILERSVVDTEHNTVSVNTDHFSKYMLVSRKKWTEAWQKTYLERMQRADQSQGENDIQVVIDTGSEFYKDNESIVKSEIKRVANAKLNKDRIGLSEAYGFSYEADYSVEEDISYSDGKKYYTSMRKLPLSTAYVSMRSFLNTIQIQDKYATVMQELESMKDYFNAFSDSSRNNRIVIWVSSSLLTDASTQRKQLLEELKNEGIKIYQLGIGIDSTNALIDRARTNIENLGGKYYCVNNADDALDSLLDIKNELLHIYPDYEILFLFNPGQSYYYTASDKMEEIISVIDEEIDQFGNGIMIGIQEIYRVEDGEAIIDSFDTPEKNTIHSTEVYSGILSSDTKDYFEKINELSPKEESSDGDFVRKEIANYFLSVDNISTNTKKIILISEEMINKKSMIQEFIDQDIQLFVVFVGTSFRPETQSAIKKNIRLTGGDAFFASNTVDFEDSMSLAISYALGRTDDKDYDKDGLTDCQELTGMVLPDSSIVYTDPRKADTDNDGLSDGKEMGVDKGGIFCYFLTSGDTLEYSNENANNAFVVFSNAISNPTKIDSDNDGYNDTEESSIYANCLNNDLYIYGIKDYDDYISVDSSGEFYYDTSGNPDPTKILDNDEYGGNQAWFYDEYNPIKNDINSIMLENGGCGIIAASDNLIYLEQYNIIGDKAITDLLESDYTVINNKNYIQFSAYNNWVRKIENDYINLKKAEDIASPLALLIILLTKEKAFTISDKDTLVDVLTMSISNGSGTYGTDPVLLCNGLNNYLKEKNIDEICYNSYFLEDIGTVNFLKKMIHGLSNNYPVILQFTGNTMLKEISTGNISTHNMHNVTVNKLIIDKVKNSYKLICSSWSGQYEIDLIDYVKSSLFLDDLAGSSFPHKNIDMFARLLMNSGHGIVVIE